ncbi:IMP cyclohydrolase [Paenibacillus tarimensis]
MQSIVEANIHRLETNPYPGRGIIIGLSPDSAKIIQVYWIMGRSVNSRNRIFVREANNDVRNKAFDDSKLTDPSLIIYYPVRSLGESHIVSNGDQTETIYKKILDGGSFEEAISERDFEPDAPNYTPRISGIADLQDRTTSYKLSIIKSLNNNPATKIRNIFYYSKAIPGIGHCITTYMNDGEPLPSFEGEPFILPLHNELEDTLEFYWKLLNEENRISILVKQIDIETNEVQILMKNKLVGREI